MKKTYKIGVYRRSFGNTWHGGQIYFDNLISLLQENPDESVEVIIIDGDPIEPENRIAERDLPVVYLSDYVEEEKKKRRERRTELRKKRHDRRWWHRFFPQENLITPDLDSLVASEPRLEVGAFESIVNSQQLDFVFPLPPNAVGGDVRSASWIPDLQHCCLPEMFDEEEIERRNKNFRVLSRADTIVFSSNAAREDFRKWYPEASATLEVWHFCGNPNPILFDADPSKIVEKYQLPERFFLVANQFWKHKDHALILEALLHMKKEGVEVSVVCTGGVQDYRGTGHVDEFLQSIQRGGLHGNVHLLGFLDREEQWHLMRSALAVIQPSRFEGWSTVVEDCKAIGQRLILSDLDVHREQTPPHSGYFPVGDARTLAEKMREFYENGAEQWLKSREARESQARSDLLRVRAASRKRFLEIVELSQRRKT